MWKQQWPLKSQDVVRNVGGNLIRNNIYKVTTNLIGYTFIIVIFNYSTPSIETTSKTQNLYPSWEI